MPNDPQLSATAGERGKSRPIARKQTALVATKMTRTGAGSEMRKNSGEPRRAWRHTKRKAERRPSAAATGSQTTAEAVQLAIGLLTASLDSPHLEAHAMEVLIPDPAALGDLLAGQHIVAQLLLLKLHEATGQPPVATLQQLAILAEMSRDTPSTGQSSAE